MPKTADLVAANLRRQIIRGELLDGDSLPSQDLLTKQYQVSRPILREAFRILESERLIEVRRGAKGGATVRMPDVEVAARYMGWMLQFARTALADVHAARRALEAPAAAVVAASHDDSGMARLRANLESADAARDGSGLEPRARLSIAREFHATVVALSGNDTLTLIDSMLGTIIARARLEAVDANDTAAAVASFDLCDAAHRNIYDLIETGRVAASDERWREHLDDVATLVAGHAGDSVIDLTD